MAINKAMRLALKALSYQDRRDLEHYRRLVSIKTIDPLKKMYETSDIQIYNGDHMVPVRIYRPDKRLVVKNAHIILFLHGGGWVSESVETYNRVCHNLAVRTNQTVYSVDYRLAPEYRFPLALEDCYAVAKELFLNHGHSLNPDNITLVGDSAGGNLAAALSILARDRGEFMPKKQILIYPCVDSDFGEDSSYPSVIENGTDYLLTRENMKEYISLYKNCEADLQNPYFSPIKASDLGRQPETMIITAEFDPLRDEGEAYAKKLADAGNQVELHRIEDALHGFFSLSTRYFHVKQLFGYINAFLNK